MSRPMISVTVKGDLKAQVAKAFHQRLAEIQAAVGESADSVRDFAKSLVPVSDEAPHIRDQIVVDQDGTIAQVGVFRDEFYYGHFIEFGTSTRPARPFLAPAVERERNDFEARIRKAIE